MEMGGPCLYIGKLQSICLPVVINNFFSLDWCIREITQIVYMILKRWQSFALDHLLASGGTFDLHTTGYDLETSSLLTFSGPSPEHQHPLKGGDPKQLHSSQWWIQKFGKGGGIIIVCVSVDY